MNKNIFGMIVIFGLVSTIALFMSIFLWAFNNDYILYELNVKAEDLKDDGLISQYDVDQIEAKGNEHATLNFYFDYWWLASYIIMFIGTILVAYYSKEESTFSFLSYLFFGSMVLLFAIFLVDQFTGWFIEDIFYKMLPHIEGSMPIYEYYMAHMGIISFIHFLLCLFANMFHDKIKESGFAKEDVLQDTEVI